MTGERLSSQQVQVIYMYTYIHIYMYLYIYMIYVYVYMLYVYIYTYTVLVKSSIPDFLNFSALFETCVKTWSIIIIPEQSINHLDLQLFGKPRKAIAFIQ